MNSLMDSTLVPAGSVSICERVRRQLISLNLNNYKTLLGERTTRGARRKIYVSGLYSGREFKGPHLPPIDGLSDANFAG